MKRTLLYRGGNFLPPVGISLIRALGWEKATILQTLTSLLDSGNGKVMADGERWVYGTYDGWIDMFFPMFSKPTLNRYVLELERQGLLISCQPEGKFSRKKYYRIGEGACSQLTIEALEDKIGKIKGNDNRHTGDETYQNESIPCYQNDTMDASKRYVPLTNDYTTDNTLREPSIGSPCGEQEGFSLDQEASPTTPPQLIPSKQEASTSTQSGAERSASEQKKEKVAKKERKPRERNPIIDAIAAIDGPIDQVLPSKWSLYAKIAKEILSVCPEITTEEINKRVARYRAIFPTAAVTSTAIASHWAKLSVATKEERREANIRYI